jgi:hypothetical protein
MTNMIGQEDFEAFATTKRTAADDARMRRMSAAQTFQLHVAYHLVKDYRWNPVLAVNVTSEYIAERQSEGRGPKVDWDPHAIAPRILGDRALAWAEMVSRHFRRTRAGVDPTRAELVAVPPDVTPRPPTPRGWRYVAFAHGHRGQPLGPWHADALQAVMAESERSIPNGARIVVRTDTTSDGTYHGAGRGRVVAQYNEPPHHGRWVVEP